MTLRFSRLAMVAACFGICGCGTVAPREYKFVEKTLEDGATLLSLLSKDDPALDIGMIPDLGDYPKLAKLEIGARILDELDDSEQPKTFPTVKSLTIKSEPTWLGADELMAKIAEWFPRLESLTIDRGDGWSGYETVLRFTDVSPLGVLPLRHLNIHGSWIRRIEGLEKCPLQHLELSYCPLSSVKDICKLPKLRRLVFYRTGVTRVTQAEVESRFPELSYIWWDDAEGEPHGRELMHPMTKMEEGSRLVMAVEQAKTRIVLIHNTRWDPEWEGAPEPPEDYGIVWEWRPADDPGIRKADLPRFGNPDECKGRDGGRTILMTASGGAFAAIDVDAKKVRCYGVVGGNPHSIEVLPDGRYVIASSDGNALTLVDVAGHPFEPAKQVKRAFPFASAHGVHWDAKRKVLWAIGKDEIAKFAYDAAAMKLTRLQGFALSEVKMSHGHDLVEGEGLEYAGRFGKDCLAFTAHEGIGWFDMAAGKFVRDRCQTDSPNVKSLAYRGASSLTVVPKERWWTDTIGAQWGCEFGAYVVKGAKFYKARFLERGD